MALNQIPGAVVDSALKVHSALGPGLLESAYEACLCHELKKRGLPYERQKSLPIIYDGEQIDAGYRIDLLVEQKVIVELKAIEAINPIHKAQLLSYLKLSGVSIGLLLNFNVPRMIDGIVRLAN